MTTASGQTLGKGDLRLRKKELEGALKEFAALPKEQRSPTISDPATAQAPKRPVPKPPANGLILRGYCTYLRQDDKKQVVRADEFYYKQNPDRWKVETQSDFLWLTEAERDSLIPANPRPGDRHEVAAAIQRRFYGTIGIDYMEGSVSALPTRKSAMSLIVDRLDDQDLMLRLEGYAHLGEELDGKPLSEAQGRGCEIRLLGKVHYDRRKQAFTRFDAVGVGRAWGRRTNEIRLDQYPWMYGVACELVTGDTPQDLIPPYNLLHYNPTGPYFGR
ncbi:MAG TPA: hypothetical protein VKE40_12155 [Gemmataceae bacterium]|nr:hypothetical protein [Gemmataceae bacterium]